jgi:hypothetical protein
MRTASPNLQAAVDRAIDDCGTTLLKLLNEIKDDPAEQWAFAREAYAIADCFVIFWPADEQPNANKTRMAWRIVKVPQQESASGEYAIMACPARGEADSWILERGLLSNGALQ